MTAPETFSDQTVKTYHELARPLRFLILGASLAGLVLTVVHVFGLYPILDVSYYFLLIALYLPAAYLLTPARSREGGAGWTSLLFALAASIAALFLAGQGPSLVSTSWIPPKGPQFALALLMFILVLEAARRAGGAVFAATAAFFALYPAFAHTLPGILWAPPASLSRTLAFDVYSGDALLGVVTRTFGEVLIGYLVLAALLTTTGASGFFLDLALALLGRRRGGPAKVAVLASGFFGSLSGSILGNVASTGALTIPTMKRAGFPAYYAAALEACASTGGMLMPPVMGAVAFIMADFTGTEYATIVIAAAIPSLLYYFGLYCHADAYAARVGLHARPESELPSLGETLKQGWPFVLVLAFLLWALVVMRWERQAPFYAAALLLALTALKGGPGSRLRDAPRLLLEIARLLSQTLALLLPASFIVGGLMATGAAPALASQLVHVGGGNLTAVLAIGVGICLVFGMMGMITAAYLMLALTLAPALEQIAGLDRLAIHLFIAYYATLAAITPPVALAAFLASRISGSAPLATSCHAARLGVVLYVFPFFFLFEPALILRGTLQDTLVWVPLNLAAIMLIAWASEGWLPGPGRIGPGSRCLLFVAGLLTGFPEWLSTMLGLGIAGVVMVSVSLSRQGTGRREEERHGRLL